jgi:hypothetical protein
MLATVLGAVDARLESIVICVAGGDFATLALEADEIKVERWVAQRTAADGIDRRELEARIRERPPRTSLRKPASSAARSS